MRIAVGIGVRGRQNSTTHSKVCNTATFGLALKCSNPGRSRKGSATAKVEMDKYEILARGYLPKELPPPFTSKSLATAIKANRLNLPTNFSCNPGKQANVGSRPTVHNLARVGILRRELSIPNPINYFQLAEAIDTNQQALLKHVTSPKFSLTTPQSTPSGHRAINPVKDWGYVPIARSLCRASARYILQTDIDNFYPSIYTHVIPWALHTKLVAKQNRNDFSLIGNVLDLIVRNSQDQQTLGIPIGPDCSLVIAEIVLSTVDVALGKAGLTNGFRYLDDYEFGFATYSAAEQGLADLQGELGVYELHLNPRKTQVVELPRSIERPWATELRGLPIRQGGSGQQTDLIGYFSRAYELSRNYPDEAVLRFALGRTRRDVVTQPNWSLYEATLLHIAAVEPGTLSTVLDDLYRYDKAGYQVDRRTMADVLLRVILQHGRVNHGSEVAWAIWGCLLFGICLDYDTASQVVKMEDSVVAILALDAKAKGLISNNFSPALWGSMMTTQSLFEENWLLSYEANVKSWLPSFGGHDHVDAEPRFSFLKQNGVHFYDAGMSTNYQPVGGFITEGSSKEGQPTVEPAEEASG